MLRSVSLCRIFLKRVSAVYRIGPVRRTTGIAAKTVLPQHQPCSATKLPNKAIQDYLKKRVVSDTGAV